MTEGAPAVAPYVLATCCPSTQVVFDGSGNLQRDVLKANVEEHCALIERAAATHDARLIAFPQFGLTGFAMVSNDQWVAASLDFSGPELARIGEAAKAAGAYVVIQAAERHAAFPGRYFLSAAIITPQGDVGLAYRKHYTLSLRTSPIDVYDAFLREFGRDALFPVLETPIGRIGLTIGAEVHWPEVTRSLALNGAEIIVNPVAGVTTLDYMNRAGAKAARATRAFENIAYLAMANMAMSPETPASEIYDYYGASIGSSADEDDLFTLATIDIGALRAARSAPGYNLIAQLQPDIHDDSRARSLWPKNTFPDGAVENFEALLETEARVWQQLRRDRPA